MTGIRSHEHDAFIDKIEVDLVASGYKVIDCRRPMPHLIAVKDGKIYAVTCPRQSISSSGKWKTKYTIAAVKRRFAQFDDMILHRFRTNAPP